MSRCPNCGRFFDESAKFKCPNCGSLLVFGRSPESKPSFLSKIRGYKSLLILVALAFLVASVRMAKVLNAVYWIIIAGILVAVLIFWLRGKGILKGYRPQQNRIGVNQYDKHKKHANVIPFRKKRDSEQRAKRDR